MLSMAPAIKLQTTESHSLAQWAISVTAQVPTPWGSLVGQGRIQLQQEQVLLHKHLLAIGLSTEHAMITTHQAQSEAIGIMNDLELLLLGIPVLCSLLLPLHQVGPYLRQS